MHSLSANLCYPDDRTASDALASIELSSGYSERKPDVLIETKVACSDYGDIPRDMTLREYAEGTGDHLRENFEGLPRQTRKCQLRYARRLDRLLR